MPLINSIFPIFLEASRNILTALVLLFIVLFSYGTPTHSQEIELKLLEVVPIPTPRPAIEGTDTIAKTIIGTVNSNSTSSNSESETTKSTYQSGIVIKEPKFSDIKGSLKNGLKALSKKEISKALSIRAGMKPGSLDRKILAWAIAISGKKGIPAGTIQTVMRDLPSWPGQNYLQKNFEKALANENHTQSTILKVFANRSPESIEGATILASAHLANGNKKLARSILAPLWKTKRLNAAQEKLVLSKAGNALSRSDHRYRMHKLFYDDRTKDGLRQAGRAEQTSLAKARFAVIRNSSKAASKIKAVAASSKKDPAYLFTRIAYARKSENYKKAASLLLKAPDSPAKLVDGDEWWVERRIVSRGLLDEGNSKQAYKIAANHSAQSRSDAAEAEFHAGWYALRFLKNKSKARKHFQKILEISSTPISQARGHYWLGRASSGDKAKSHYKRAAYHTGTFYGQLAAQKLGIRKLKINKPRPSAAERSKFTNRELVKAIKRLESVGYNKRARIFYFALAKRLNSAGEIAMLAARAEKNGDLALALSVGKTAYRRGLDVDSVAWPIGAIPNSANIGATGKALAYAIARQESAFNKAAVSKANARGLLQLLPGTAKLMAKATGVKYSYKRLTRDAGYNATLGAAYLSEQLEKFDNSYILTIAGYNAGPRRASEWIERFGDPRGKSIEFVVDWIERIPFTETRNYVQRVMENYQVYKTRLSNTKLDIENDLIHGRK